MKAGNTKYLSKSQLSLGFSAIGLLLASTMLLAQPQDPPRNIVFFGRVKGFDPQRKVVTVKHGKIPDYMDAATLNTQPREMP
jgi:hypothetical protein